MNTILSGVERYGVATALGLGSACIDSYCLFIGHLVHLELTDIRIESADNLIYILLEIYIHFFSECYASDMSGYGVRTSAVGKASAVSLQVQNKLEPIILCYNNITGFVNDGVVVQTYFNWFNFTRLVSDDHFGNLHGRICYVFHVMDDEGLVFRGCGNILFDTHFCFDHLTFCQSCYGEQLLIVFVENDILNRCRLAVVELHGIVSLNGQGCRSNGQCTVFSLDIVAVGYINSAIIL